MRRVVVLCLLVAGTSCADAPADALTWTLKLWQPERFTDGRPAPLLSDAARVDVMVSIDGVHEERSFGRDAPLQMPPLLAASDESELEVHVETVATSLVDARARSGVFRVGDVGERGREITAVLAPHATPSVLHEGFAPGRVDVALCALANGDVLAAGGLDDVGIPTSRVTVLSRAARDEVDAPSLVAPRTKAACVDDGEGGAWVVGGCSIDGAPRGIERRHADQAEFVMVAEVLSRDGCDVAVARAGASLFLLLGDVVEIRDGEHGGILTTVTLPRARPAGHIVALADDPPRALVFGGGVDGSVLIDSTGSTTVGPPHVDAAVGGSMSALVYGEREMFALDGDGVRVPIALPAPDVLPMTMLHRKTGGPVFVDAAGAHLFWRDETHTWRDLLLEPPRPGAQLVEEPGGALLVLGGAFPDVWVVGLDAPPR